MKVHNNATVTGSESEQAVPLVDIPDIDLTPYYNWANAHGEVRNGFTMSGGTYTPNGGVLWVNGSVTLSSSYTFNVGEIAEGKVAQATEVAAPVAPKPEVQKAVPPTRDKT